MQRSFRGHLLVSKCLTQQLVAKVTETDPGFENHMKELGRLYTLLKAGEVDLNTLLKSDSNEKIIEALTSKKCEFCNSSMTSKLWLNYQQMLGVAQQLIKADCTGSWKCTFMLYLSVYPLDIQGGKLVQLMMDNSPALKTLLKMIRCTCISGCSTLHCSCKKHGLECTSACGQCQAGKCDNILNRYTVVDDDEIDHYH